MKRYVMIFLFIGSLIGAEKASQNAYWGVIFSQMKLENKVSNLYSMINRDPTIVFRLPYPLAQFGDAKLVYRFYSSDVYKKTQKIKLPLEQQKNILRRLILTGNTTCLKIYFECDILFKNCIDHDLLAYAQERAQLRFGNHRIPAYLQALYNPNQKEQKSVVKQDEEDKCSICLTDFHKKKHHKACVQGHRLHRTCLKSLLESGLSDCPVCRGSFKLSSKTIDYVAGKKRKRFEEEDEEQRRELLAMLSPAERALNEQYDDENQRRMFGLVPY